MKHVDSDHLKELRASDLIALKLILNNQFLEEVGTIKVYFRTSRDPTPSPPTCSSPTNSLSLYPFLPRSREITRAAYFLSCLHLVPQVGVLFSTSSQSSIWYCYRIVVPPSNCLKTVINLSIYP